MTSEKRALILGISGQDGAYLGEFLLKKGYQVYGGSRDVGARSFRNLKILGIDNLIELVSINLSDFRSVLTVLTRVKPDEIYNLAGQSSVGLSFEQPVESMESIGIGTLNLLEALRFLSANVRLYNAGSSECFGDTGGLAANEKTPFTPSSPYAVAKSTAYWQLANYRDAYGLHACTGILFNHESPLRPERFVTKKIVAAAIRISNGSDEKLRLGNIDISRDWGWAPEYVEAMWLMLQRELPKDYVIATGKSCSLATFVEEAFSEVGLDWKDHVQVDPALFRPSDITINRGDPSAARQELRWSAKTKMPGLAKRMVAEQIKMTTLGRSLALRRN